MSSTPPAGVTLVYDDAMASYRFSDRHPMNPERLGLTARLIRDLDVLGRTPSRVLAPYVAEDDQLRTVHSAGYVEAVKRASGPDGESSPNLGLGTEDDPIFPELHEASARLFGGSIVAAEAILEDKGVPAVNFGGGMHHAARAKAGGFCIYNDAAGAIARLLDQGAQRVLYLDLDAHHGDGTQAIFWDEPRVMTISLHESGRSLFPGTGFPNETGGAGAPNSAVNVALPAGTRDNGWLRAFHSVVVPVARAFEPDIIVSQHGCDGHERDELTNLRLTVDGQRQNALDVAELARELCEGRWIATGGGGYDIVHTVPRVWTHLVAAAAGRPLALRTPVPAPFREYVKERYGLEAPPTMGDDTELWWRSWEVGYDPGDSVDRAIMATRKEVFPALGLDPWFD
ncbi:acetoin utilization protein AcuC [Galactobacter valiniphilus]|uniref:acetoin utilization protein AcuC n=1 Tax=Galactobacter valiniphilus TaxID=2676122 RepID=UPI003734E0FA